MKSEAELIQTYKDYLSTVSAGNTHQMDRFVAEQATFNGLDMTPKSYGEYIDSFRDRCEQGLHWELVDIVVDAAKRRLASKLIVSGKPTAEFFGVEANGREVRFNEAAFYLFNEEGKIVKVNTMVDRGDIADSLAGKDVKVA